MGLSTSQVDGDGYGGYNKAGLIFGGYVLRPFSERWSGLLQIKYWDKGSTDGNAFYNVNNSVYKLRLHYLEIPVLLQLSLKKNIFFRTGFGFGYLIKALD